MNTRRSLVLFVALAAIAAACGGGDDSADSTPAPTAAVVPTTQDAGTTQAPSDGGGGGNGGSAGVVTATLDGMTYEMTIEDPCFISDLGIAMVASGNDASLEFGGFDGAVTLAFTAGGVEWFGVAASVMVQGDDMFVYDGTVGGNNSEANLSFTATCTETVSVPGLNS